MANGTSFFEGFGGLLAGGNPLFDVGLGLLSQAGPSTQPVSLGQALAASAQFAGQRGRSRLVNSLAREKLLEASERRRAGSAVSELIASLGGAPLGQGIGGPSPAPGLGLRPAARAQAFAPQTSAGVTLTPAQLSFLQIAAKADPQAALKDLGGLLFPQPQDRRENSLIAQAKFAFPDNEEKQRAFVAENVSARGGTSEQLDLLLRTLQVQNLQDERSSARTEKDRQRIDARLSVFNTFDHLDEIAQINARLRGTFAETGLGFDELRRAAAGPVSVLTGLFGGDDRRARQAAADIGRFEQLTTREAVQGLFGGQVQAGTLTDAKLGTFLRTKPGVGQLPETNNRIIADMMRANLDSAIKLGVEIPNRAAIEAQIKRLRAAPASPERPSGAPATPPAGVDPALWSVMTEEEKALWR